MILHSSGKNTILQAAILLFLSLSCLGREILVPRQQEKAVIKVFLGQNKYIGDPSFNFSKIYKKQVFEIKENGQIIDPFHHCRPTNPEVQFKTSHEIPISGKQKPPLVIYNFEDVIHSQFLLDAFYDQNLVYLMFENKKAVVAEVTSGKNIENVQIIRITGLNTSDEKLGNGYFIKFQGSVLFINNKYAIKVSRSSAVTIQKETPDVFSEDEIVQGFQSMAVIQDKYLAIGFQRKGVFIYQMKEKAKLEIVSRLNPQDILPSADQSLELNDLAYYQPKNSLLVLEQNLGVISFEISTNTSGITLKKGLKVASKQNCELMSISGHNLYVTGEDIIYKYFLGSWPNIQENVLAHPNINIREIYEEDDILAYAGRNSFKLMYLDQPVEFYQENKMDKVVFKNGTFISASEDKLVLGTYKIIKPYVVCRTTLKEHVGMHRFLFQAYAECNETYLTHYKVNKASLGVFTQDDICIYSTIRTVQFIEPGSIKMFEILVLLAIFVGVSGFLGVSIYLKHRQVQNVALTLAEYQNLKTSSGESGKYQKFSEEMEEKQEQMGKEKETGTDSEFKDKQKQ